MPNRISVLALSLALLATGAAFAQNEDRPSDRPVAILEGPLSVGAGVEARYSARASFSPSGSIASFAIDFGDGTPEVRSAAATHAYASEGAYDIRVRVVDDRGRTAESTRSVTALPRPVDPLERLESRRRSLSRSGLVVAMVEDAGGSPYGRFAEEGGRVTFQPFAAPLYGEVRTLAGPAATVEAFFQAIRDVAAARDAVDVLVFGHGSRDHFSLADGGVSGDRIVEELRGRGGEKIRMVWSSTCWGKTLIDDWRAAGARAAMGAEAVNYPLDFPTFWLRWLSGTDFQTSVRLGYAANARIHRFVRLYGPDAAILLQSAGEWIGRAGEGLPSELSGPLAELGGTFRGLVRKLPPNHGWDLDGSVPTMEGETVSIEWLPPAPK